MRLKNSRRSGSRRRWSNPSLSLTWLLTAFFLSCYASQYLLIQSLPEAEANWLTLSPTGIRQGFIWQFFTNALAHPSILQLFASVLPFFILGSELEPIVGPRHLAGAFIFTQIPASAASLWWSPVGGQMGIWPGVSGLLAVLGTMLPMLEFRYRLFVWPLIVRVRWLTFLLPAALAIAVAAGWITRNSLLTIPSALILGYFYARWLGYGMPTRLERYFYERKIQKIRWQHLPARQFIEQEVDPILEKITRDGWQSVTRKEKKILRHSAKSLIDR